MSPSPLRAGSYHEPLTAGPGPIGPADGHLRGRKRGSQQADCRRCNMQRK